MVLNGIHPKLLKECAGIIAKPLYLIFSKSLENGVFPTDWKLANIYHQSTRKVHEPWQAIIVTCLASKLMESIIRDAMVQHLVEN